MRHFLNEFKEKNKEEKERKHAWVGRGRGLYKIVSAFGKAFPKSISIIKILHGKEIKTEEIAEEANGCEKIIIETTNCKNWMGGGDKRKADN